jgi:hypothetical protein
MRAKSNITPTRWFPTHARIAYASTHYRSSSSSGSVAWAGALLPFLPSPMLSPRTSPHHHPSFVVPVMGLSTAQLPYAYASVAYGSDKYSTTLSIYSRKREAAAPVPRPRDVLSMNARITTCSASRNSFLLHNDVYHYVDARIALDSESEI